LQGGLVEALESQYELVSLMEWVLVFEWMLKQTTETVGS
jgi:hypothetical protein